MPGQMNLFKHTVTTSMTAKLILIHLIMTTNVESHLVQGTNVLRAKFFIKKIWAIWIKVWKKKKSFRIRGKPIQCRDKIQVAVLNRINARKKLTSGLRRELSTLERLPDDIVDSVKLQEDCLTIHLNSIQVFKLLVLRSKIVEFTLEI